MDLLWQINYGEMLSGLIVTTFLILLDASVVVVCSMVMFPLIDLAFKKKAKPAPRPAQVETWQHDGLTAHAQLSGRPWLALRSDFLRPAAVPHSPLPLVGMAHHALADPPLEHITSLIVRLRVPKGSEGAPTGPVTAPPTPLTSNCGRASETLFSGNLFSAKGRPGPPGDPNKKEPGRPSWAA
jgi:hypothetical protein